MTTQPPRRRIEWTYTHHVNRKSCARRTKKGDYYGSVKHTCRHKGTQMVIVQFDGNKGYSTVPESELKFI